MQRKEKHLAVPFKGHLKLRTLTYRYIRDIIFYREVNNYDDQK